MTRRGTLSFPSGPPWGNLGLESGQMAVLPAPPLGNPGTRTVNLLVVLYDFWERLLGGRLWCDRYTTGSGDTPPHLNRQGGLARGKGVGFPSYLEFQNVDRRPTGIQLLYVV